MKLWKKNFSNKIEVSGLDETVGIYKNYSLFDSEEIAEFKQINNEALFNAIEFNCSYLNDIDEEKQIKNIIEIIINYRIK